MRIYSAFLRSFFCLFNHTSSRKLQEKKHENDGEVVEDSQTIHIRNKTTAKDMRYELRIIVDRELHGIGLGDGFNDGDLRRIKVYMREP